MKALTEFISPIFVSQLTLKFWHTDGTVSIHVDELRIYPELHFHLHGVDDVAKLS